MHKGRSGHLSRSYTHTHTHTHTHTPSLTPTRTHTPSLSPPLSLSRSLSCSLPLSQSHSAPGTRAEAGRGARGGAGRRGRHARPAVAGHEPFFILFYLRAKIVLILLHFCSFMSCLLLGECSHGRPARPAVAGYEPPFVLGADPFIFCLFIFLVFLHFFSRV